MGSGFSSLGLGPELEALNIDQLGKADMLVFGEKTYQGMAAHWPTAEAEDTEVAPLMNRIAKIVCSPTCEKAEWNNTTIIRDAVAELPKLKEAGEGDMYIFGSGNLSQSLMNAGLLDEIRLCVAPVILGKGRRLFTETFPKRVLKLLDTRPLSNGGVILRYAVHQEKHS